ncbi:hypothetical protein Cgig2_007511 [Carnegiea gigantea]|uniref:Uncharacterized protein n=1 Tax=Carnegiea gigantea TaxID=171969 RepID=A0A9Q1JUD8_9CARY|nr:hypothetical protein Cgig2_007511 [Carnegiea gigantea]
MMLLNTTMKLGVLRGWMIDIMESALKELWWSTFEEWVQCNRNNILRAHRSETDSDQEEGSGRNGSNGRSVSLVVGLSTSRLCGKTFSPFWGLKVWRFGLRVELQALKPLLVAQGGKEAACDFDIPKMIQATLYAMVVNHALDLGIMSRDMTRALKLALEGLQWLNFES